MNKEIGCPSNPIPEVYYDEELGRLDRPYSARVNEGLYIQFLQEQGATRQQISETKISVKAGLPNGELSGHGYKGSLLGKFVTKTRTIEIYPDWAYTVFPDEPDMGSCLASQTLIHETSHSLDSSKAHLAFQMIIGGAFDLKYGLLLLQAATVAGEQLALPTWSLWGAAIAGTLATVDILKPIRERITYSTHPLEIKARKSEEILEVNPIYRRLVELTLNR